MMTVKKNMEARKTASSRRYFALAAQVHMPGQYTGNKLRLEHQEACKMYLWSPRLETMASD